jgi:hypothetical protein
MGVARPSMIHAGTIYEVIRARARILGVRFLRRIAQDVFTIQGSLDLVMVYSDLHPNHKLRGTVARYYELGSNLVTLNGRRMSAGLTLGTIGPAGVGISQSTGHVIRGMALGSGSNPVLNTDTELQSPILRAGNNHHYHEIDGAEWPGHPSTEVIYIKTFGPLEPRPGTLNLREFGLYTAAPDPATLIPPPDPLVPVETTPPGPSTGFYMVARKVHGLITKTADFSLTLRWKWVF